MRQISIVSVVLLLVAGCGNRPTNEWVEKLKAKDSAERLHAIRELSERPQEAAVVVPALTESLKDVDPFIRRDAAYALAKLGPDARPAMPALRPLLKDRNHGVRKAATEALKKIDGESAVKAGIEAAAPSA